MHQLRSMCQSYAEIAPMSNFELHVERVDRIAIVGWAFDRSRPNRHVYLSLYDGNLHLVSFYADQYRKDLHAAKIGGGDHAFYINLPAHLIEREIVEIRLIDPITGKCHYIASAPTSEAKLAAAKNLIIDKFRVLSNPTQILGIASVGQRRIYL